MQASQQTMAQRLKAYAGQLPVAGIADSVVRSLRQVPRLVVTAPPGAGKSTLLPLALLDSLKEGRILMLEPRRLAARQIAERMASMLGERVGQTVGYRVRFESKVSGQTRIEVLTEGILARMMVDDPTLDGVAMVVFDEFHERSLASDLALALARETQRLVRPDMQLLIMSATIDATAICLAFDAPHIESKGRMHHVDIRHADDTDAARCAADVASAVMMAHRQHQGDILAFLPGQAEIVKCSELLGDRLGQTVVCRLYGMLPPEEQRRAIMPLDDGRRKVVLATPIAETSITIEGVRVVIDSGLCRTQVFDPRNALGRLETVRITMDMANQRSGRAGRVADGVCYRLWTKATELRMADTRRPEMADADLAPLLLTVAAWGEADVNRLPWLTPPPKANVATARRLLVMLKAFHDDGRLSRHGRQLAALPCHPRIAQMMLKATTDRQKALAADVAALLEEKDPTGADGSADINTRISLLRDMRRRRTTGRWSRIALVAEQYRRMAHVAEDNAQPDPYATGALIASAYPERIAMAAGHARYKLATGDMVMIDDADELSACPLLAVASMDKRIFLASPLTAEALADIAEWRDSIAWDSRQGRINAQRELRVGALVIDAKPIDNLQREAVVAVMCEAARKEALSMFDFNADVQRQQRRIAAVAEWHPDMLLPDVGTEALVARVGEWLPLYAGRATTSAELKKIDLTEVMWGLLSYEQQTAVERLAPLHIVLPSGRRAKVDYRQGAEAPVVSVRLQECFGLTDTPCVDGGSRRVLMELLSPGFKPVQLTQDLRSFWQTTYPEVRKELRRRYPKHDWRDV